MKLGFKKKQREQGKGGQPLELGDNIDQEAAEKAADLSDVLGDIDKILDQTAKVERHESCCHVTETRKW